MALSPFLLVAAAVVGQAADPCDRVLEDFASSTPGAFPTGWTTKYAHNLEEAKSKRLYVVERDAGRNVLHATYGTHTVTLVRQLPAWNLEDYPWLQWRWKAVRLPTGGDENTASRNDSAASVYIAWDAGFPFRASALRFAWSSTQPRGSVFSNRFGHDRIVIVASGQPAGNGWQTTRVDVLTHARALLDTERPAQPTAIAITTDADDTESSAEAYYADFRLCRRH